MARNSGETINRQIRCDDESAEEIIFHKLTPPRYYPAIGRALGIVALVGI